MFAITFVNAQETMYIYKNGSIIGQHELNQVDSVIFYKPEVPNENSVTDIDGNVYKTVVIGTQTWMAENLRTTKYNDGTEIPNIKDGITWSELTTGAYCWYENDEASYKEPYGGLYNWYVVETGKLCPSGWHVPSNSDWETLINYLGGNADVIGGMLKEVSLKHWNSPNTGATNDSGFTALSIGYRDWYSGTFNNKGYYNSWWSTTLVSYISLHYDDSRLGFYKEREKEWGFNVRCIKGF